MAEALARELSSVNAAIRRLPAEGSPLGEGGSIGERLDALEGSVKDALGKLYSMNRTLARELRDRNLVDRQLAAFTEQNEAAFFAVFHDVLIALPNRALFDDRLEHRLAQAERHGRVLAVMFVDLDDFKSVNDSLGHETGDEVLEIIARRLSESTRSGDTVSLGAMMRPWC